MIEPNSATNRPSFRARFSLGRLIDDFIILASGQFLAKIFGFIAFAWLARQLTVAEYGAVETAVGMAAIGAIALELGTGAVGVRRIAQKESTAADVLGLVITARLLLAILIAPLLAIIYIQLTRSQSSDALFWLFALSLFAIPFNHNWLFQSVDRMGVAGFGQTLKMAVFLAAVFLLAPQRNGVVYVALAEVIAAATLAIWFSAFAFSMLRRKRPGYSLRGAGSLLGESANLGAASFVNALAQYLPVLVVASVVNYAETAQFGASQRLLISLMTFSYLYYFNLYPLMARTIKDDAEALQRIMSASVRVTAWVGVTLATLLWALAPQIMEIVFGKAFSAAGAEFGILVWSGALILASGNARWLLIAGKRQGSLLGAHLVNAGLVVGLSFVLAPELGGVGAAIACNAGALGLWIVTHERTRGLAVRPDLRGIFPAACTGVVAFAALSIFGLDGWRAGALALAILAAGIAIDGRFASALKILAKAKSAA